MDEAADSLRMVFGGAVGPMRDIAVLNAAAALVIGDKAGDLKEGLVLAGDAIDSGRAAETLEKLIRSSHP